MVRRTTHYHKYTTVEHEGDTCLRQWRVCSCGKGHWSKRPTHWRARTKYHCSWFFKYCPAHPENVVWTLWSRYGIEESK